MIDVKEAVRIATEGFKNLYGETGYKALKLEEVEITPDERYWIITLGYNIPEVEGYNPPFPSLFPKASREYKEFKIDAESGRLLSMKIRVPWTERSRS